MRDERLDSGTWILRIVFGLVPIIAGLDKFFDLIVYWPTYLSATAIAYLPSSISPQQFMYGVGVVEIIAGILVLSPAVRVGAYLVAAWMVGIAINLILGRYYDIAVRDVAMAASSFALGQLVALRHGVEVPVRRRPPVMEPTPAGA